MVKHIKDTYRKEIRKLWYLWPTIVNHKNFIIPKTVEEYKLVEGIFAPKIRIEATDCFFNEKSKSNLNDFASTLYDIREIKNTVSYAFVYNTTISSIEKNIYAQLQQSIKPDPGKDVEDLIKSLFDGLSRYQFFRILEGIELKEIDSFTFGDVELFVFSKKHEIEISNYREPNNINGFFDEAVEPFIKKHFLNNTCIRTISCGDEIKAKDIAIKKITQVVNILRFIVCLLSPKRIYENLVKINLLAESYDISENTIHINLDNKNITLNYGTSRKPLQKLPIDSELFKNLKEYYFFDDLVSILLKNSKTELEEAILTAIYWTGEAQNDFIRESAFIKFGSSAEFVGRKRHNQR